MHDGKIEGEIAGSWYTMNVVGRQCGDPQSVHKSILMTACNAVFIYEACAEYGKCVSFAMKTSDLHIAMNIQAPILYNRQII